MNKEFSDLQPLLTPKSIAIIGASSDPGKAISQYVGHLLRNGYKGEVYPINPNYKNVYERKCFKSVLDIPGEVDTASIALKNDAILGVLEECARKGVKTAIVFTSGFAEIGGVGKKMQDEMTALARRTGIRILGPNCNGIININDKVIMSLFFNPELKGFIPGDVAMVSQSGTVPLICLDAAYERGVGYRCLVAVGDEADLEISDFLGYMADESQTKVITGYVEGFKDVKKFMRAADSAVEKRKPIILLHATQYEESLTAARYHTGAYTEPGYEFETIFREKGVITVDTPEELIEISSLFSCCPMPQGDRVGIFNTSGGLTVLSANISAELDLDLPPYSKKSHETLQGWLKFGTVNNPIDLTGQIAAEPEIYEKALHVFAQDENFDILVISLFTLWRKPMEGRIESIVALSEKIDKPIITVWPGGSLSGDLPRRLLEKRIPVFRSFRSCLKGVKALIQYSTFIKERAS
jgi:acyl-CoA synthetase (NDP forming)